MIHLHTEVKIKGEWIHHSEANIKRGFKLYGKMANVRNYDEVTPISLPKGLPEDVTFLTRLHSENMGPDGHSHSWLNAHEIVELHEWANSNSGIDRFFMYENFPRFIGLSFDEFAECPEDWEGLGVEDVRYVFFFDN